MGKDKESGNSKQLLTLGLLIGNVAIMVILMVIVLGAMSDMNKMVSAVDQVISSEYTEAEVIPLSQQQVILLDEKKTINIVSVNDEQHVLQYSVGIIVDKEAKDLKKVTEFINGNSLIIYNEVKKVIQQRTLEDITKITAEQEIIEEIVKNLRVKLETESIVDVVFSDFVYS